MAQVGRLGAEVSSHTMLFCIHHLIKTPHQLFQFLKISLPTLNRAAKRHNFLSDPVNKKEWL